MNCLLYLKMMHTGVRKILCLQKNFEATSIKVDSFIFSYATHLTFAQNFEVTPFQVELSFLLCTISELFSSLI